MKKVNIPNQMNYHVLHIHIEKLVIRPTVDKIPTETPKFLKRIQGDICRSINLAFGTFKYFTVLIYDSTRWSNVSILPTRNVAFATLFAQIIRLKTNIQIIQ